MSVRMLRHYDLLGLLEPSGHTSGGHREYSQGDLRRLFHVESLRSLGLTLRQVSDALSSPDFDPQELVGALIKESESRIAAEQQLLDRLRHVANAGPEGWEQVLVVVELLQELASPDPSTRQRAALTDAAATPAPPGTPRDVPVGALTEAALREAVPNVAGALRWALERSGGADLDHLAGALTSTDPTLRRRATDILCEMQPSDRRHSLLVTAMDDDEADIRARAALTLGGAGDAAAAPELVRMVVTGVRDVDAADALAALSGDGAPYRHTTSDDNPGASTDPGLDATSVRLIAAELAVPGRSAAPRIRLLQALHELRHPDATEALRDAAGDSDGDVARVATAFLTTRPTNREGPER